MLSALWLAPPSTAVLPFRRRDSPLHVSPAHHGRLSWRVTSVGDGDGVMN